MTLDKTPYTAIVLSGVEGERFMETAYNFANCRHMLMSILYIEQKGTDWFQKRVKKYPDVRWVVDSGGHSFRTEGFCPKWPDWQWFDDFAKRYQDWLLENKDVIDLAVNLDVDCLDGGNHQGTSGPGFSKMMEYDHEIFLPLERSGVPVCYVWHENYGYDYWLKLCREHEYVGLPGTLSEADYYKMMRPAMMNGCRVHGFACTKSMLLGKVPFASADSSVAGKSRLLLKEGGRRRLQSIESLFSECKDYRQTTPTEVVGDLGRGVYVHTLDDNLRPTFARVKGVIQHRVKKRMVRITLRGGKTIEGTDDHSFFTLDKEGNLVETKPTSLRVGDCLVASAGSDLSRPMKRTPVRHPIEFEGVWFGDGYVTTCGYVAVSFGGDKEVLDLCQKVADAYHSKITVKPNGQDLIIWSRHLGRYLTKHFGRVGKEKRLDRVHNYSQEDRARFLRGWFSADGSVGGHRVELVACYDSDLCHQAQLWLEDYDIRASYSEVESKGGYKPHTARRIMICDLQSRLNFMRYIGFIQKRKNDKVQVKVSKYPLARGRRGLPVSLLRSDRVFTVNGKLSEIGRPVNSRDRRVCVSDKNFVPALVFAQMEYTEIQAIEVISEDEEVLVYDLSVEKYERFFAEGILAHNTTWKSGERFGQTFVFESSKLNVYDHNNKEVRQRYKAQWVAKGVDWDLLEQDKAEAISQVAAIAWGELQEHITTLSAKLAYWSKTSRLADDLGAPEKTDPTAVNKLMEDVGCPIRVDNQSDAVGCLEELQWILGRHPEVMDMEEENLDWWIEQIQAEPENTTRVEKEACIRQRLYEWFYKINASEAKARDKVDVDPVIEVKARVAPPPDVEATVPELPDSPSAPPSETTAEVPSSEQQKGAMEYPDNHPTEDCGTEAQVSVDTGFIEEAPDRIQRSRATLALDLLFEQFKLRHEADLLKRLRVRKKRMQECRRQANALVAEISSHTDSLDPSLAEKVRDAAQEMFDQWIFLQQNEEEEHIRKQREVLAKRPQNRALATRASEIGRLGGAPRGNQNARKHGLSSKKMPALACDNCPHIQVCPQYRAGHVCAFIGEFEAPLVTDEDEEPQVAAVRQILEAQIKRARRALLYETFEGGILNKQTSNVLQAATSAAKMYHDMKHPPERTPFGPHQHAAPEETKGTGFLAKIFGDMATAAANAKEVEAEPVDEQQ